MSIVLGSLGITPLKVAEEYTMFSNYGKKEKPRLVLELKNRKKGLDVTFLKKEEELIPPYQAYLMTYILQDVVKEGTGRNAKLENMEVAGKTGTTNDFRDAWWCGYTPSTTTIVWFGNDDNTPIGKIMTGGRVSAPVFKYFYQKFLELHPELKREFEIPKGVKYFNVKDKKYPFTNISPPPSKKVYVPVF